MPVNENYQLLAFNTKRPNVNRIASQFFNIYYVSLFYYAIL